ncbi:MAG TPA: VWA domain-containing protein, partial [Acidobacteriaceae bacterium]|nr:VWA domain-containing protein [Acidobacteriaceae bacterium]
SASVPAPAEAPVPGLAPAPAPTPAPPPAPEPVEFSVSAATGLPSAPAAPSPSVSSATITLKTTARLVDVDVVAYDKKGHPLTDLTKDNFQILDDGHPQTITSFAQAGAAPPPAAATASAPGPLVFTNRTQPAATQGNTTILMIDAANLPFTDLAFARSSMMQFLREVPAGARVGLYILSTPGLQVLDEPTTDHAEVAAALAKWTPSGQDLAHAQNEEARNRQQIDEVHKESDLFRVNGNISPEDPDASPSDPVDLALRDFGDTPTRDDLAHLVGVARHLAPLSGHKNLVWVTSDNVLADWTGATGGNPSRTSATGALALYAQEALNNAHVSVYPLDASHLEGSAIDASLQHRNVQLTQAQEENLTLEATGGAAGGANGPTNGGALISGTGAASGEDASLNRNMAPGRITAEMQQDLHPIQDSIMQLATATGGRALPRVGDIGPELNGVIEDGRAAYLLSFTPNTQPDNQYHHLTVRVIGHRDVVLRYRTGYLYQTEPTTVKDRFLQAMWQPSDTSDIALTATPDVSLRGPSLRLNVTGTDLEIAQDNDRWTDKLDFFFVQRDGTDTHARVAGQTLTLNLKPGTYQEVLHDGVPFNQALNLQPTTGSVRVVVLDENSGRMGTVTIPASVLRAKP